MLEAIALEKEIESKRCKLCDVLRAEAWGLGHSNWTERRCGQCWKAQAEELAKLRHVGAHAPYRRGLSTGSAAGARPGPVPAPLHVAPLLADVAPDSATELLAALRARDPDALMALLDSRQVGGKGPEGGRSALQRHFGTVGSHGAATGGDGAAGGQPSPLSPVPAPEHPTGGVYYHDAVLATLARASEAGAGAGAGPAAGSDGGSARSFASSAMAHAGAQGGPQGRQPVGHYDGGAAEAGTEGSPGSGSARQKHDGEEEEEEEEESGDEGAGHGPRQGLGRDGGGRHRGSEGAGAHPPPQPGGSEPAAHLRQAGRARAQGNRVSFAPSPELAPLRPATAAGGAEPGPGPSGGHSPAPPRPQSAPAVSGPPGRPPLRSPGSAPDPAVAVRGGGGFRPQPRPLPSQPRPLPTDREGLVGQLARAEREVVFGAGQRARSEALLLAHQLRAALADLRLLDRKAARAQAVHRRAVRQDTRDEAGTRRVIREGRTEPPLSPTAVRRLAHPEAFYEDPHRRRPRWLEHVHPPRPDPARAIDVVNWRPPSAREPPPRHTEGLAAAGDWAPGDRYRYDWELAWVRSSRVEEYRSAAQKEREYLAAWAELQARARVSLGLSWVGSGGPGGLEDAREAASSQWSGGPEGHSAGGSAGLRDVGGEGEGESEGEEASLA